MELVAFVKLDFVEKRELEFSLKREEGGGGESESPTQKKRPKFLTV